MKTTLKLVTILLLGVLAACGDSSGDSNLEPVTVTVTPAQSTVDQGGTVTFEATVANTANTAVTWSVEGTNGGTIDQTGHYTAPTTAGTFTVVATAKADAKTQGTAKITVNGISVVISPTSASIGTAQTGTFTAKVTGSADTAVTWSVVESGGGTVDQSGVYTAPTSEGTFHVRATSQADPLKSATAAVTVTAVQVAISPADPSLDQGQQQQFAATVSGTADGSVTWSVDEADGGTIDATGLYTSPSAAGVYHVRATSAGDPSKSGATSVHVMEVQVAIGGIPAAIDQGASADLTATVTHAVDTAVTWSSSPAGLVDASGHFTAPFAAGPVTITATRTQNPVDTAVVTVNVNPVVYTFSPADPTIAPGGSVSFTVTVTETTNTNVTWSALGGTIDQTGLYTAPTLPGTFGVITTGAGDGSSGSTHPVVAAATGLAYTDPVVPDTDWRLVKDATYSSKNHLVLDLLGPTGGSGGGVALTLAAGSGLQFTKVQPADTEWVENAAFTLGTTPRFLEGVLSKGHLVVGVFQKGTPVPATLYASGAPSAPVPLIRVALDYVGTNQAGGVPLSLTVIKAMALPAGGPLGDITVDVGTLSTQ